MLRIDYVWVANDVQPLRAWTLGGGASDHRPLVVDVSFPKQDRGRAMPILRGGPPPQDDEAPEATEE